MRRAHILPIAAIIISLSTEALSRNICWIDEVRNNDGRAEVFFSGPRQAMLARAGATFQTIYTDSKVEVRGDGSSRETPAQSIIVEPGDRLVSWNTPEDSCEMKAAVIGGKIGIEARASFHDQHATDFIPAK